LRPQRAGAGVLPRLPCSLRRPATKPARVIEVSHSLGGSQAKFRRIAADGVGQLRTIANQPVTYADGFCCKFVGGVQSTRCLQ
jgi:hypothetical protein